MRIAQVILPSASEYERKCQRVDFAALSPSHEVRVAALEDVSGADVAHIYASGSIHPSAVRGFPIPYIASADVARVRWPFRRPVEPDYVVSPLLDEVEQSRHQPLPEAVEDRYFEVEERRETGSAVRVVGSFRRQTLRNSVEQTLARIERFRDDVRWQLYDHVPEPSDFASIDAWIDPALHSEDLDGFVAEAVVAGLPVVATRTPINAKRLEQGRTGALVPPGDPNEMTHAILAALFKPEVAHSRVAAARQTASKFRARQRMRVLTHMYETLIS